MNYDYDLVIIGQRPAAIAAAELALTWGARVAIVMSTESSADLIEEAGSACLACLAIAGIDVLRGRYRFVPRGDRGEARASRRSPARLNLQVSELDRPPRTLRSRTYLLAPDAQAIVPALPGLLQTPHVAIGNPRAARSWLAQFEAASAYSQGTRPQQQPQRAIVYGGQSLIGLELALTLVERGVETQLVSPGAAVLGRDDSASLMPLWQLQAIASGLNYYLNRTVQSVQAVGGEIWLYTHPSHPTPQRPGNRHIADALLIADRLSPQLDLVHLHTCGVTICHDRVWVDRHLRSTHPQIYACAAALNGHDTESIATHEALTATRNALLPWRRQTPHYRAIPWGVATAAGFACVGFSLAQAQAHVRDAMAIDLDLSTRNATVLSQELVAAQVVVTAAGDILGATIIGDRAADLITPLSLAIRTGASIAAWNTWAGMTSTAGTLGEQLYRTWHDHWWQSHPDWRDHLKSWFDDRRS